MLTYAVTYAGRRRSREESYVSGEHVGASTSLPAYVSIRQQTSADVSRRQHTSAYVRPSVPLLLCLRKLGGLLDGASNVSYQALRVSYEAAF
jgi:hypothetical protein